MRTLIYLLIIAMCFTGCEQEKPNAFPGPKGVSIVLIGKDGQNLFNSNVKNQIEIDKIKNLFLIDGELVEQYHAHFDSPKMCVIVDSQTDIGNVFFLGLSAYFNSEGLSTTVVDWGNGDSDTIQATVLPSTKLPYSEFWYNGVSMKTLTLKAYTEENADFYYEIKKDY
ncbi:MAG: hypothetical protein LBS01_03915 [Prevotellaceae bacterium]|jgi:hypothetical protein|nr:hypothetical protein [Prevotellaceae bacterium]